MHSFGALGIVYEMKIDVRDEYALTKCIYADVPMDIIRNEENFNWLNYGYDFVAYFTDWKSDKFNTLYLGDRISNSDKNAMVRLRNQSWEHVC